MHPYTIKLSFSGPASKRWNMLHCAGKPLGQQCEVFSGILEHNTPEMVITGSHPPRTVQQITHTAAYFSTQLNVEKAVIPTSTPETEMWAVREENKELCKGLVPDLICHLELTLSSGLIHVLSQ